MCVVTVGDVTCTTSFLVLEKVAVDRSVHAPLTMLLAYGAKRCCTG